MSGSNFGSSATSPFGSLCGSSTASTTTSAATASGSAPAKAKWGAKLPPNFFLNMAAEKAAKNKKNKKKKQRQKLKKAEQASKDITTESIPPVALAPEINDTDAKAAALKKKQEKRQRQKLKKAEEAKTKNIEQGDSGSDESGGSSSPPSGEEAVFRNVPLMELLKGKHEPLVGGARILDMLFSSDVGNPEVEVKVVGDARSTEIDKLVQLMKLLEGKPEPLEEGARIIEEGARILDVLFNSDVGNPEVEVKVVGDARSTEIDEFVQLMERLEGKPEPLEEGARILDVNSDVGNPEVEVKVVGDARPTEIDEFGSQRELQNAVSENKEKFFCTQTSGLGIGMAWNFHASSEFYIAKEARQGDGAIMSEPLAQPHSVEEDQEHSAKVYGSATATTTSQLQTPNAKSRKQERKNMQASGPFFLSPGVLNSIEPSNEACVLNSEILMAASSSENAYTVDSNTASSSYVQLIELLEGKPELLEGDAKIQDVLVNGDVGISSYVQLIDMQRELQKQMTIMEKAVEQKLIDMQRELQKQMTMMEKAVEQKMTMMDKAVEEMVKNEISKELTGLINNFVSKDFQAGNGEK